MVYQIAQFKMVGGLKDVSRPSMAGQLVNQKMTEMMIEMLKIFTLSLNIMSSLLGKRVARLGPILCVQVLRPQRDLLALE